MAGGRAVGRSATNLARGDIVLRTVGTAPDKAENNAAGQTGSRTLPKRRCPQPVTQMSENDSPIREEPVCTAWQRMLEVVLGVFLLGGAGLMVRYFPAATPAEPPKDSVQRS